MPKFTVEHQSPKAADATYDVIKNFMNHENEIKKFDANAKFNFNDQSKTCSIESSKFKAELSISQAVQGCKVQIEIDLPFLLMPFKGKVQESLTKMLKKHLA